MTTFEEPEKFEHPVNCCCVECARKPHRHGPMCCCIDCERREFDAWASKQAADPLGEMPFNVIDSASVPVAEETFMKMTFATHNTELGQSDGQYVPYCKTCGHSGTVLTAMPCEPPRDWWKGSGAERKLDATELFVTGSISELQVI